jgi:hypothetical protein
MSCCPFRQTWAAALAEVKLDHGQGAVDTFIREFDLETLFGFKPGTEFKTP